MQTKIHYNNHKLEKNITHGIDDKKKRTHGIIALDIHVFMLSIDCFLVGWIHLDHLFLGPDLLKSVLFSLVSIFGT